MKRASRLFPAEEKRRVEAAVAAAERRTAAEIVPVVATASGRYDRGEDLFGVVVALVALGVTWLLFQGVEVVEGEWAAGARVALGFWPVALVVVAGFLAGAVAATRLPVLRLPFIARGEMAAEVERAAAAAFHRFRLRRTTGGVGLLVYVSLYEHLVRVLPDDELAAALTQPEWDEICRLAVDGMARGRPADGLVAAIERASELLARALPRPEGAADQLTNELQLVD